MTRISRGILNTLMVLPWWVSIFVSASTYLILTFVVPPWSAGNIFLQGLGKISPSVAPYFALLLVLPAPVSVWNSYRKRMLLENIGSIESIRLLDWKEFEELVAEAYRKQGFKVIENTSAGPDGGIDVRLEKNGLIHIVQCKQWKSRKVGVSVVREMYGILVSESASSVIVICSGEFTQEAKNFAENKPIDLVSGVDLVDLVGQLQSASEKNSLNTEETASRCPRCGDNMILRIAKKGANAGGQFYGCSSFPKCRHTRSYND